jgi:murein L,D-transpeptidase YcbB/YkuD
VSIRKSGVTLWQQTIANGNTTGFNYDLTASVYAGEAIDFVINKIGNDQYDSTAFDPAIVLTAASVASAYTNPGLASVWSALNGATGAANTAPQAPATPFTYVWNRDLQIGSPFIEDVTALQTALTRDGEYAGDITGGFYNQTYLAVKAFQQKHGIETTGFVGPLTRTTLNTLFAL